MTVPFAHTTKGVGDVIAGVVADPAVTVTTLLMAVQPPEVTVTLKAPDALTIIDCDVAPVLHKYVLPEEEVSTVLSLPQNDSGRLLEIVGVKGVDMFT